MRDMKNSAAGPANAAPQPQAWPMPATQPAGSQAKAPDSAVNSV
jgi:hypothetical protein